MNSAMMFEDSVGGSSSMLNTSMKSEGGASAHNTSRGEEAAEVGGVGPWWRKGRVWCGVVDHGCDVGAMDGDDG